MLIFAFVCVKNIFMKEISLDSWKQVGEGGNGKTYLNDAEPGVLLKVNYTSEYSNESLENEFYISKKVYDMGISTPKMIELVKVGNDMGIKIQAIQNKKSLSRLCADHPEEIEKWASYLAERGKELHATDALAGGLPSLKERVLKAISTTKLVGHQSREKLLAFAESLDDAPTFVHGDFQFGNIIIAEGKPCWIDLGRASHGVPQFDLGHLYLICNVYSKQKRLYEITHMTEEQLRLFWKAFALAYNGPEGLEAFNSECRLFGVLDLILLGYYKNFNLLTRIFLSIITRKLLRQQ